MHKQLSIAIISLLTVFAISASAFELPGKYGIRFGQVSFMGGNDWWAQGYLEEKFEANNKDFTNYSFGVEGNLPLTGNLEYNFGVDYFQVSFDAKHRNPEAFDYLNPGPDPKNEIEFTMIPINVCTLKISPFGREGFFHPYGGVGFTLLVWRYRESGYFYDKDVHDYNHNGVVDEILAFEDSIEDTSANLALTVNVGVELSVTEWMFFNLDAKMAMAESQLHYQHDYLYVRPNTNPIQMKDVRVHHMDIFYPMLLDDLQVNFSVLFKLG